MAGALAQVTMTGEVRSVDAVDWTSPKTGNSMVFYTAEALDEDFNKVELDLDRALSLEVRKGSTYVFVIDVTPKPGSGVRLSVVKATNIETGEAFDRKDR